MHELAICRSIVTAAGAALAEHAPTAPVVSVGVRVGRLTGIDPECLRFCFALLVPGTSLAGAALVVEQVPVRGRCQQCAAEFIIDVPVFRCPPCGSDAIDLLSGQEIELVGLETAEEVCGGD